MRCVYLQNTKDKYKTKRLTTLTPEIDCDQAMDLPTVTFAVFLICHFGKSGGLGGMSEMPFAIPPGIKREWYVCMFISKRLFVQPIAVKTVEFSNAKKFLH
jgi:hypothetical protein